MLMLMLKLTLFLIMGSIRRLAMVVDGADAWLCCGQTAFHASARLRWVQSPARLMGVDGYRVWEVAFIAGRRIELIPWGVCGVSFGGG